MGSDGQRVRMESESPPGTPKTVQAIDIILSFLVTSIFRWKWLMDGYKYVQHCSTM